MLMFDFSRSLRVASLAAIAALAAACAAETGEPTETSGLELRDTCSGDVIGHRDPATGDIHLAASDRTIYRRDIEELDAPGHIPACADPRSPQPAKLWATSTCWHISEGGAGCEGCYYPKTHLVWEYCWDT
jgi:hypothetical protein